MRYHLHRSVICAISHNITALWREQSFTTSHSALELGYSLRYARRVEPVLRRVSKHKQTIQIPNKRHIRVIVILKLNEINISVINGD